MARGRGELLEDVDYHWNDDRDAPGADSDDAIDAGAAGRPGQLSLLSAMDPKRKFRVLKGHYYADQDASSHWRSQATQDFGFVAGEQLSTEDKALLDSQQRPHIVFNRVQTILKAIAGMQINGRSEIKFLPRNNDDTEVNEILTAASKWMAEGCDAEDEQSEAFQNCCATGMGWTESRFSYDDDPDGAYVEESIDPREMLWDRTARKKNLVDARRMSRIRRMPLSDALQMFPGKSKYQINASWADNDGADRATKSIEEKRIRDGEDSYEEDHNDKNEVTIVCTEWWEREPYWRVADPMTNILIDLSDADHTILVQRFAMLGMQVQSVQMTRKRYYRAWLGNEYLGGGPAPCGNRFSWACITGEFDKQKRFFYGLVRVMRDPQMWANKFMSQIMHIMNTTAKGGILAEVSAFEDQEEAEETYAMPESVTWMADGALSGQKPKIMPKPGQGDASAYVNLLQLAISSIKDVTGINLELLGQQDQNQPGILEHMRKQAGMTVLATQFDSLRRFLKIIGDKRLHFIQTRMSDGRLIRVVGDEYTRAVPLARDSTTGQYDVIIDDAPTSPNQKEANWAIMQPMLAVFKEQLMGNPKVLIMVLRYSPLPAALVEAIAKVVLEAANNPEAQQRAQQLQEAALNKLIAETNKDQSVAALNNSKSGATEATAIYDIAMAKNMMADNQRATDKHMVELQEAQVKQITAVADARKAAAEVEHIRAKIDTERQNGSLAGAKTAAEILRQRTAALMESRKHDRDDALAAHQVRKDRHEMVHETGKLAIEGMKAKAGMIGAIGGFHRDMAGAKRDHVGAKVDARPEPRPVAK